MVGQDPLSEVSTGGTVGRVFVHEIQESPVVPTDPGPCGETVIGAKERQISRRALEKELARDGTDVQTFESGTAPRKGVTFEWTW